MMIPARNLVGITRVLALMLVFNLVAGPAFGRDYLSPDATMTVTESEQSRRDCEAIILFKDRSHVILTHGYVSADHNQGSCAAMAKWTPNSQFFVFSLEPPGGHQPYHTPIYFFPRRTGQITLLEDFLPDPVTEPVFTVSAPDVVECTTCNLQRDGWPATRRSIHLNTLSGRNA